MLELFIACGVAAALAVPLLLTGRTQTAVRRRLLALCSEPSLPMVSPPAAGPPAETRAPARPRVRIGRLIAGGIVPTLLLLGAATGALPGGLTFLAALLLAGSAFLLPRALAARRERRLRESLLRSLPDVIDLLVVCIEAGLGLNAALQRVAERIGGSAPAVAQPFQQLHLEIQAGRSREEALRLMAQRSGVTELRSLAVLLIQTDRLGSSVAHALRIHADGLRSRFHHEAESRAAKATVHLAFPLVFCIFPALLAVVVGPAAVKLLSAFGSRP